MPTLELIFSIWLLLLFILVGNIGVYYYYLRRQYQKPWSLCIDENFEPHLSIIVPAHNEEETIFAKLESLKQLSYPREKIEIIIADDASTDSTLAEVKKFVSENPQIKIKVMTGQKRSGKACILNGALEIVEKEIILVSDADCFFTSETLHKSLAYLADSHVGAITGFGKIDTPVKSSSINNEKQYLELASIIRVAESKIHSTIRFEGGFCLFLRKAFDQFDDRSGSDDSGTALEVVQRGYRSIGVPEAVFVTSFPDGLLQRIKVKSRRAHHLVCLWIKCLRLMIKGKLLLPKRIAIPEIILFLVNPLIFLSVIVFAAATIIVNPFSFFTLFILLLVASALLFARKTFAEIFFGNSILVVALLTYIFGKRYVTWDKQKN